MTIDRRTFIAAAGATLATRYVGATASVAPTTGTFARSVLMFGASRPLVAKVTPTATLARSSRGRSRTAVTSST